MTIREKIQKRARSAAPVQHVATPEWPEFDGQVAVRKLSAKEMDGWYNRADPSNGRGEYAALVCCDLAGNRLFNDGDGAWLGDEPFSVIDRVFEAGMTFNRTSAAAKAELEKNSPSGTAGGDSASS